MKSNDDLHDASMIEHEAADWIARRAGGLTSVEAAEFDRWWRTDERRAAAVARLHPDALVLGADTTVALGDRALNKPADLAESRAMLRRLSGREHTVHTGICLLAPALGIDEVHDVTAWVRFRSLSDEDITRYQSLVDTLDKAGAYGIQQGKEIIIDDFQRPISTIMGLPVEFVHSRLLALGVLGRLVA